MATDTGCIFKCYRQQTAPGYFAWIAIAAILLARVAWSIVYIHGLKSRSTLLCQRGGIRVLASAEVRHPWLPDFCAAPSFFRNP